MSIIARTVGVIEWLADADRVADDDISLQLRRLVSADDLVLEGAESGRDAVCDLAAVEERLHRGRAPRRHSPSHYLTK